MEKPDLIVWRPTTGQWFWARSSSGYSTVVGVQGGNQSLDDVPLLGDLDGDHVSDLVIWRASTRTWYWLTSSTGYTYGSAKLKPWGS
jgi:hypothetical protein